MKQEQLWQSRFGEDYTERNIFNPQELDVSYLEDFGITRTDLNKEFLTDANISSVLEVGCNVANQLRSLQNSGYTNLFGIELQPYAVERAKELTKNINIVQGSAFDLPFRDNYFDLVYTCGVLIHIAPDDILKAIREIYRVSGRYIWGFEYFSENYTELQYRGETSAMWKGDFKRMFMEEFPDLKLVKEKKVKYVNNENVDLMFLLEKR
jgi:pseudaminic acid biosynthesis-associated methylase